MNVQMHPSKLLLEVLPKLRSFATIVMSIINEHVIRVYTVVEIPTLCYSSITTIIYTSTMPKICR